MALQKVNRDAPSGCAGSKVAIGAGLGSQANPKEVVATVVAVIPELMQAKVETDTGFRYSLTRKTPGVDVTQLLEGQQVVCTVAMGLPRVLSARALT